MNYIILNGKKSIEIEGLLISSLPPITKPQIRVDSEEIDGRDGDIITKLGYSAYDKEIEIGLHGKFDIDQVISYFDSEGVITFSNEPDKYYNYTMIDSIDFERLIRFKTATVTFHVQPFKYSTIDNKQVFNNNLITFIKGTYRNNNRHIEAHVYEDGLINLTVDKRNEAQELYIPIKLHCDGNWYVVVAGAKADNKPTDSAEYVGIRVCKDAPNNPQTLGHTIMYLDFDNDVNQSQDLNNIARDYNYLYIYVQPNHRINLSIRVMVVAGDVRSFSIFNKGNTDSKPLLKIRGSGSLELSVNSVPYPNPYLSKRVKLQLNLMEEIIIDVNDLNAYRDDDGNIIYMNRVVLGEYDNLMIGKGHKYIIWGGTGDHFIESIEATNYSRWI